jgi:hypothetical protein
MTKPIVWLLDVDGVLNTNKPGWSSPPLKSFVYANGESWKFRWSHKLIERIWEVHIQGSVEILWATTWCGHTDQLERLFKLPAFNSAYSMPMDGEAKTASAIRVIESGKKLIWTDDEFVPTEGAMFDYLTTSNRGLLIKPKANKGLQPEHLDQIDKFVLG